MKKVKSDITREEMIKSLEEITKKVKKENEFGFTMLLIVVILLAVGLTGGGALLIGFPIAAFIYYFTRDIFKKDPKKTNFTTGYISPSEEDEDADSDNRKI